MKKFISIISILSILVMSFSFTAFAANSNVYTVTTAKSAAAGDKICVQVELSGDFTDVAVVQYGIKYDTEKFAKASTANRAPWTYNKDWYNSTKDGNPENLGYIATPGFGENPVGTINVGFVSTDQYYIDDGGDLYGDGKTTIAGMIEFTALVDVASIDASCFELINAKVLKNDGSAHSVTVNQIVSATPDEPELADDEVEVVGSHVINGATELEEGVTEFELGTGVYLEFVKKADFTNMIWAFTVDGTKKYSAAKAIDISSVGNGSPVILTAAFANGNIKAFDQEAVAPVEIEAVNAIFKAGEAEYFTDLTDKKPE